MSRQVKILYTLCGALFLINIFVFSVILFYGRSDVLKVYFLDVGQGDSILIESPSGGRILIDGGPGKKVLSELGSVLPFYDNNIDLVIATHPDKDHISGLIDVFKKYNIKYFISSGVKCRTTDCFELEKDVKKSSAKNILAKKGMKIDLGEGTILEILYPDKDVANVSDTNDGSIVVRLTYGKSSFVFTGDAPAKIERHLVDIFGESLKSDVLKAGHHGSRTASSLDFVRAVSPYYGIILAGLNNSYGHPHRETLDTFKSVDAKIFSTLGKGKVVCRARLKTLVKCW